MVDKTLNIFIQLKVLIFHVILVVWFRLFFFLFRSNCVETILSVFSLFAYIVIIFTVATEYV